MTSPKIPESNFKVVYYGTAAERDAFATRRLGIGNRWETEAGDVSEWTGTQWIQTSFGGAVGVATSSDSVTAYGNYPETWFSDGSWDGAADAQTTTISSVESFNTFTLELHTLTATSATVSVSIDGTNFSDARLIDLSTGAVFATNALTATGIYQLQNMKFSDIKITQAGAGAAEVRYSLGNT